MLLLKTPKIRHVPFAGADCVYIMRHLRGKGKTSGLSYKISGDNNGEIYSSSDISIKVIDKRNKIILGKRFKQTLPCSTDIQNYRSHNSTPPPIYLHGVKKYNFTFYCKTSNRGKKFQSKRSKEERCIRGYKVHIEDKCNQ